jgi:hypothetical protein
MNVTSPSSAVQLALVGRDAVWTRSRRWRGLPAWLGRWAKVCERKEWIACCSLFCIVCLSGCQRQGESVAPPKTRAQASGQVAKSISRERAIVIADAETRRRLKSWGCPVPEVIEMSTHERPEKDGWTVFCVYEPRDMHGYITYEVLRDGSIYELEDWIAHELNSQSEEERKGDFDELLRMFRNGRGAEDPAK